MNHIGPRIHATEDIDTHDWTIAHYDLLCQIMHYIPNAGGVAADFVLAVNEHDDLIAQRAALRVALGDLARAVAGVPMPLGKVGEVKAALDRARDVLSGKGAE